MPSLDIDTSWDKILQGESVEELERILPGYLTRCRWFGGKSQVIKNVRVTEAIPIPQADAQAYVVLLQVDYAAGSGETYALPLAFVAGQRAAELQRWVRHAVLARLNVKKGRQRTTRGVLYDASQDPGFSETLLAAIAKRRSFKGSSGDLNALSTRAFKKQRGSEETPLSASPLNAEQSNTSILYDKTFVLKLFRRPVAGVNPDFEIGRFLTERTRFRQIAPVAGALEYQARRQPPMTLGILHGFVSNEGDAWRYTLDAVRAFSERALANPVRAEEIHDSAGITSRTGRQEAARPGQRTVRHLSGSGTTAGAPDG